MKCSEQVIKKLIFLNNTEERKKHGRVKDFDIFRNMTIMSIEYLSLKNNLLKNLNFVKYLPKLWYLDARDNPVSIYFYNFFFED
jgi:Leucine-rich repeat (LRR) protein